MLAVSLGGEARRGIEQGKERKNTKTAEIAEILTQLPHPPEPSSLRPYGISEEAHPPLIYLLHGSSILSSDIISLPRTFQLHPLP